METAETTLHSAVQPPLLRRALLRGSCLAAAGGACLLLPGIFMPLPVMQVWGLPLFLAGMGLIALGLIPYRKLKALEENPYRIILEGTSALKFTSKGKPLFTLPRVSIKQIGYTEEEKTYGIAITLKSPLPEKLRIEKEGFDLAGFRDRSLKQHNCDLFLPYFSRRSFDVVNEWINEI